MATVTELPGVPAPVPSTGPGPVGGDAAKEKNDNWRFLEPQPVREDQVENAVKFLSHPKVKGSPVIYRRSFLEKKGLSREEIDEAFQRVPDPPSETSATTVPTTGTVSTPPQPGRQTGPVGQPSTGQVAAKSTSWTQMLLALGVLTAAGAGAGVLTKRYFIPKLKEWILDVASGKSKQEEPGKASKPSPVEEATATAAAAAAAAATAATQVAGAMQEIAKSKSEDRQRLDSIIRAVEAQTQELKNALAGMKDAVQNAEVTKYQRSVTNSFQSHGGTAPDYWNGQTNGIRSTSVLENQAVTTKLSNSGAVSDPSAGFYDNGQVKPVSPSPPTNGTIHAPHSQSYLDVMAMLERGEKPPGIREVNDKPPNPNQSPSNARLQPRPKPWERATVETRPISPSISADSSQLGGYNESWNVGSNPALQSAINTEIINSSGAGSSFEPWWRKKADTDASFSSNSVKITEVDLDTQVDIGTVQVGQSSSSSSSFGQSGGGRSGWVPPAVPQPVYPGADEAIRRPKSVAGGMSVRSGATPPESGSATSASSSPKKDEGSSQAQELNNSKSNTELPEQRAEVPDEQEPDYLERSLVDPNRSFKDVVQEGDN